MFPVTPGVRPTVLGVLVRTGSPSPPASAVGGSAPSHDACLRQELVKPILVAIHEAAQKLLRQDGIASVPEWSTKDQKAE